MLKVVKSAEAVNVESTLKPITLLKFHATTFAVTLERSLVSIYSTITVKIQCEMDYGGCTVACMWNYSSYHVAHCSRKELVTSITSVAPATDGGVSHKLLWILAYSDVQGVMLGKLELNCSAQVVVIIYTELLSSLLCTVA